MKKLLVTWLVTTCLLSTTLYALQHQKHTGVMFVQHAETAELSQDTHHPDSYLLTLRKPGSYVSYFSNRPTRITGIISIQRFSRLWNKNNKHHFLQDPPNAALESEHSHLIGTLTDPTYHTHTGDISYHFTPLTPTNKISMLKKIGYTVLFIDDVSWDPGGFGDGDTP